MSESAYDAERTVVKRFVRAVERCAGGDSGEAGEFAPLLAPDWK
jgi:hypothetical protein